MVARLCNFTICFLIGVQMSCTNQTEKKILKIHLPKVTLSLDPHKMEDAYSMAIVTQLYRGLARYSASGDVLPDLAESWKVSAEGKSYEFKLRSGSKFSDGSPMTSRNVQMSFARMFFIGAAMAADIDYIKGVRKFRKTKNIEDLGVKIKSNDSIEFVLEKPSGIFLSQVAVTDCAVLPINDFKEDLTAKNIFSGPYKVEKSDPSGIEISKWRTDVLDSKNPPKKIRFILTDEAPITLAKEGKTDTLDHDEVNPDDKNLFLKKGWAPSPTELTAETFVILNPASITQDVRRYLVSRFSQADLLGLLANDRYKPAYGVIPDGLVGVLEKSMSDDIHSKAKFKESEIKGSVDLEYREDSQLEKAIATHLKKIWETALLRINLRPLSTLDKLGRMFGGKSQAIIGRKLVDYPDGYSVLGYFKSGYEYNYFHVNDKKIDEAITQASAILDLETRRKKYQDIQKMILAHDTVIPLFFGSSASGLWSENVKYVPSHPLGYHTLPLETVEMAEN